MGKTAIVYLCWADEPSKFLLSALDAIEAQTQPKNLLMLVIVYNGPRNGEASQIAYIRDEVNRRRSVLPETAVLEPGSNIGFSGGNNFGAKYAVEHGADYVFLHNADGFLGSSAISELVGIMDADKSIGECQPLVILHPEHALINSAGNSFHYLGIGFCSSYREEKYDFPEYSDIGYVSGAAAFMRSDLLGKYGYWINDFFLYHEDTEYSLRLKMRGYKIGLAGKAVFYHQYDFLNKANKFFWIERNRHALKLMFYRWPTLVILLPLEILYNVGLLVLAAFSGWFNELIKVYVYWLQTGNWRIWLHHRRAIQADRKISDRSLISGAALMVGSGDMKLPVIVRACVNIIFTFYWFLLKILIWW